jgi:5-methylcytosine-specific restriction enzyme subunit McrC
MRPPTPHWHPQPGSQEVSPGSGKQGGAFLGFRPLVSNFTQCPNEIIDLKLPGLTSELRWTLIVLARETIGDAYQRGGSPYDFKVIPWARWMDLLELRSVNAVKTRLARLEDMGLIEVQLGGSGPMGSLPNRYRLRWANDGRAASRVFHAVLRDRSLQMGRKRSAREGGYQPADAHQPKGYQPADTHQPEGYQPADPRQADTPSSEFSTPVLKQPACQSAAELSRQTEQAGTTFNNRQKEIQPACQPALARTGSPAENLAAGGTADRPPGNAPGVPLDLNLKHFLKGMWARAGDIQWPGGPVDSTSDEDLSSKLYEMLLQRVQDRLHQGLYRAYLPRQDRLGRLPGRLDLDRMIRAPWRVDLPCRFQEQTADLRENQILTWTLHLLSRTGVGSKATRLQGQRALRELGRQTTLKPFTALDCQGLAYHRLNEDYAELHILCRFFLEYLSPGHVVGDHPMLAFQVDMAQLFERFVAAWLKAHLPSHLRLGVQWSIPFAPGESFRADMVIQEAATGKCLAVLDTKYKDSEVPSPADIHQVRSYAEALNCSNAFLVYPTMPGKPMNTLLGRIRTLNLVFPLDGNLEQGGAEFLSCLLRSLS